MVKHLLLLACLGLLSGCASLTTGDEEPAEAADGVDKVVVKPFAEPEKPLAELDSDVVFSALVGEIALQRGELELAYRHQSQTALLTGDAVAAERAARIALMMKRDDLAFKAVKQWVRLAPNALAARQMAAVQLLDRGESEQALAQLQALVAISEGRGEDGYLHAMAALSKQSQHPPALALMQQLAAAHADDPRAGYALSLLATLWKEYPLAEQEIKRVIDMRPEWGRAYVLLGRLYVAQERRPEAIRLLKGALRKQPDDLEMNDALARLLVEDEQYLAAYRQYQVVGRLQPEDPGTNFSLGLLALQLDFTSQAQGYFQALKASGKREQQAAYYLGRTAEKMGEPELALQWYRSVERGELYHDTQIRIAGVLAAQGEIGEAKAWLKSLRDRLPEQSIALYLAEADILKEYGDQQQVMALYGEALQAHPGDTRLLYARGLYAAVIQKVDILERDMREILRQQPEHVDALNALGYTLADQTTRYAEALALINKALLLKPESPAILDSMGWLQYRMGNPEQALVYLRKAFGKLPDAEIAAHLGEVLWVSGQQQAARAVWQQMLDIDPGNSFILETKRRLQQ